MRSRRTTNITNHSYRNLNIVSCAFEKSCANFSSGDASSSAAFRTGSGAAIVSGDAVAASFTFCAQSSRYFSSHFRCEFVKSWMSHGRSSASAFASSFLISVISPAIAASSPSPSLPPVPGAGPRCSTLGEKAGCMSVSTATAWSILTLPSFAVSKFPEASWDTAFNGSRSPPAPPPPLPDADEAEAGASSRDCGSSSKGHSEFDSVKSAALLYFFLFPNSAPSCPARAGGKTSSTRFSSSPSYNFFRAPISSRSGCNTLVSYLGSVYPTSRSRSASCLARSNRRISSLFSSNGAFRSRTCFTLFPAADKVSSSCFPLPFAPLGTGCSPSTNHFRFSSSFSGTLASRARSLARAAAFEVANSTLASAAFAIMWSWSRSILRTRTSISSFWRTAWCAYSDAFAEGGSGTPDTGTCTSCIVGK
mmetsp:Transcript_2175/g.5094  ORF Transcript_2175/g.5094 Transcript_2175/m.5094 type:complete len:421 (+) Transcript_2175:150-1412(+)